MNCETHQGHAHAHGEGCGHTAVRHDGHTDYLHDGHLHSAHGEHYDEHVLKVSDTNPAACTPSDCGCNHDASCGHEMIPHGDHMDYIAGGHLHRRHGDHCDDHGPLMV